MSLDVIRMTDLDIAGKRLLIREDLNVPLKDGEVSSDARLRAALPTVRRALEGGASVLLMSHLGRPTEGRFEEQYSLAPVARRLSEYLGQDVRLERDWLDGVDVAPGVYEITYSLDGKTVRKTVTARPGQKHRVTITTPE